MKIFVLSLASDIERRARMTTQLQRLGLDFEFFDAVDGRHGLSEQDKVLVDFEAAHQRLKRPLGNGEAACALSHTLLYERIVKDNLPYVLILEDDVIVDHHLVTLLNNRFYENHHLLLLNHQNTYIWRHSKKPLFGPFSTYQLILPCWMTAAYSISQTGARYLLAHNRPVQFTADWPGDITSLSARVYLPKLVLHPEAPSSSNLANERYKIVDHFRFFKSDYWKRWMRKRVGLRVA